MDYIALSSGYKVPNIGLGTYLSKPGEVKNAVIEAVKVGYRHFDCAYAYQNEGEVGAAIQQVFADGLVKRDELFITSKLWTTFHRPDLVRKCFDTSLGLLKLSYMDLYMLHSPCSLKEEGDLFPKDESGKLLFSDASYLDAWKEMEKLVDEGLVRSLGVCNLSHNQMERLLSSCRIKPSMMQVEIHPFFNNDKLTAFCHERDIAVTAWGPLGCARQPTQSPDDPILLENEVVKEIAARFHRTPAQVLIRYAIERRVIPIPKSVSAERIKENFDVFNFKLSPEDIEKLNSLSSKDGRVGKGLQYREHPEYPLLDDY